VAEAGALRAGLPREGGVADVLMVANEFLAYLLNTPVAAASPAVAAFSGPSDDIPF